jgi:hypothetical protein
MKKPLKIIAIVILTLIIILSFGCNKHQYDPNVGLNTKIKTTNSCGTPTIKNQYAVILISLIKEYLKSHSKPVTTYKNSVLLTNN